MNRKYFHEGIGNIKRALNFHHSCDDFIVYCEIHRRQYIGGIPKKALGAALPACCEHLFEAEPFFTYSGTCFTTKIPVEETLASIFHSIQIWIQVHENRTPGFFIKWADPASFLFIFGLFKQISLQYLQQINVKKCHVHPVYGAGIRTHDLRNVSLLIFFINHLLLCS